MCSTTVGNELTRVTVIDSGGKTVYETLVKPDNDIIDYNTRLRNTTTTKWAKGQRNTSFKFKNLINNKKIPLFSLSTAYLHMIIRLQM
jgi:hypothetical protein